MENKTIKHWLVVIILSGMAASSIGICNNAVGVFYTPVSLSLHVLKGTFAFHATLSLLATAVTSLFMVKIMHTYKYKSVLFIGVLMATLSTIGMAYSKSMILFYIFGIIRGIGAGMYAMVPITFIITNWFDEKHGLATSIALCFSGLSGAICSPILSNCISLYGWQNSYLIMAGFILLFALPALIYPFTIYPKQSNLLPYGYVQKEEKIEVKKTKFNYLTIAFICMAVFTVLHTSITGITQHLSSYAVSLSLTTQIGATMMSFTMVGNIVSKLIIGFISDYLKPLKACIIMMLVNVFSLILFIKGGQTSNVNMLLIASFLFGSVYSVGAVGIPLLTKYFFGVDNFAAVYSKIGFLTSVGSSLSLTIIGYIYDFTGGYLMAFVGVIIFHIINLCLLFIINKHRVVSNT